jgi:integrase
MSREMRGQGNVYRRGATWWIRYNHRGVEHRESAHSPERKVALKLLKLRLGEISNGRVVGPVAEKVTLAEMRDALLTDYKLSGNRSLVTVEHFARCLIAHFGENARALDITSDKVAAYAEARRKQVSNASVNLELGALGRMFNLMVKAGRLSRDNVPARPRLQESAQRSGFLEPNDFARLRDVLPDYLREPTSFLYVTGWRKGAMRSLQWLRDCELDIDANGVLAGGSVRLQAEFSKNKYAQTLPLKGELLEVIRRAWDKREPECPYVFHRGKSPIKDFRKAWIAAREDAGLPTLVHDMRRSCALA